MTETRKRIVLEESADFPEEIGRPHVKRPASAASREAAFEVSSDQSEGEVSPEADVSESAEDVTEEESGSVKLGHSDDSNDLEYSGVTIGNALLEDTHFQTDLLRGITEIRTRLLQNVKHGLSVWVRVIKDSTKWVSFIDRVKQHQATLQAAVNVDGDAETNADEEAVLKSMHESERSAAATWKVNARYSIAVCRLINEIDEGMTKLEKLSVDISIPFHYLPGGALTVMGVNIYAQVNSVIAAMLTETAQGNTKMASKGAELVGCRLFKFLLALRPLAASYVAPAEDATSHIIVAPPTTATTDKCSAHRTFTCGVANVGERAATAPAVVMKNQNSSLSACGPPPPPAPPNRADQKEGAGQGRPQTERRPYRPMRNLWQDERTVALPCWIVSTILEMAMQFDGKPFSDLNGNWFGTYGYYIDFRLWNFTGFQDVVVSLPGITMKKIDSEHKLEVVWTVMNAAISQRWPGGNRPPPGGVLPPWILQEANQQQASTQVYCGSERVPGYICARILDIVTRNSGKNIGTIQSVWRNEHGGQGLDFVALGFAKFSDLLAEVPGVSLQKSATGVIAFAGASSGNYSTPDTSYSDASYYFSGY